MSAVGPVFGQADLRTTPIDQHQTRSSRHRARGVMNDEELKAHLETLRGKLHAVLTPPRDLTDASAWDTYWRNQVEHGMPGLVHMFVDADGMVL